MKEGSSGWHWLLCHISLITKDTDMQNSTGGSDELDVKMTADSWAGYLSCTLTGSSPCPALCSHRCVVLFLFLLHCLSWTLKFTCWGLPMSENGGCEQQGGNAGEEEIWKILNAPATTGFKVWFCYFFHPPDTSWKFQKFTTHILPMLPSIHSQGRTFRASLHLLKFSWLVYSSVHFIYHPLSKQQMYNKMMYLSGSQ